ncbi:MAG: hypothetical protein IPL83_03260 [Bdellovibrionales bacterium]|nr:hypothetical protein [Bdellovibrionales bacterium]
MKLKAKEILIFILNYSKNPVIGIRNIPEWDWWTIIVIQGTLSALCGMLSGFVAQSVSGVFFWPHFLSHLLNRVSFYHFRFFLLYVPVFYQAEVQFRKLYVLTVLANLPFYRNDHLVSAPKTHWPRRFSCHRNSLTDWFC